jgi:hypothetical protein
MESREAILVSLHIDPLFHPLWALILIHILHDFQADFLLIFEACSVQ